MLYAVIALAVAGLAVIARSRRAVPVEARCPTCRHALESVDVERCPHCQLWHPVDGERRQYRWQGDRLLTGILLVMVPSALYLLLPIITSYTLSRPKAQPVATWTTPVNPLARFTPAQLQQLQALGYIRYTPNGPQITPVPTSGPTKLSPDMVKLMRSLGYVEVEDEEGEGAEQEREEEQDQEQGQEQDQD